MNALERPLRPPRVTPEWVVLLELAAAERGLPFDPWPLPAEHREDFGRDPETPQR